MILEKYNINWNLFKNKTIGITGATGLIGRLTVFAFLHANTVNLELKVLVFVRNKEKAMDIFVVQEKKDTSSKEMIEHPVETIMTSIQGTDHILRFAVNCKMDGVVYLSSMEAYGVIKEKEWQSVYMLLMPVNIV